MKYIGNLENGKFEGNGLILKKMDGLTIGNFNGKMVYEGMFKDGQKHGYGKQCLPVYVKSNIDYILYYEGDFKNGCYDGDGIKYDGYGKKVYKGTFKDGKFETEEQESCETNLHHLNETKVDQFGQIISGLQYPEQRNRHRLQLKKQGRLYKPKKEYYDNYGQIIKFEGLYNVFDNEYEGEAKGYYYNGQLKIRGIIRDKHFDGPGTEYYKNGQVKFAGFFHQQNTAIEGKLYDENGNMVQAGYFNRSDQFKGYDEGGYDSLGMYIIEKSIRQDVSRYYRKLLIDGGQYLKLYPDIKKYEEGNGSRLVYGEQYFTDDVLINKGYFKNNQIHDQSVKEYTQTGHFYRISNFFDGSPYGYIKKYNNCGKITSIAHVDIQIISDMSFEQKLGIKSDDIVIKIVNRFTIDYHSNGGIKKILRRDKLTNKVDGQFSRLNYSGTNHELFLCNNGLVCVELKLRDRANIVDYELDIDGILRQDPYN